MQIGGSVALVTGGASGLGLATARQLLDRSARVVLADVDQDAGRRAVDELGVGARFVPTDVRDESDVAEAVAVAASLGPLRTVVNCAGVGDPSRVVGRAGPLPLERFRRVIDVNLVGTFNVTRIAVQHMTELEPVDGERGVVVNTASVAAFDGQIGQASYAASKGAIAAMTLPLAREFARYWVRVMTIAPGMFETPILRGLSDEARSSLAEQVPHPQRLGYPSEYGRLVVDIVENSMLNGETIRLDGALRMAPR